MFIQVDEYDHSARNKEMSGQVPTKSHNYATFEKAFKAIEDHLFG